MASIQLRENNNNRMSNTKIHICPVDDSWDSTIRQYFSKFGQVKSIAYHSKNYFDYGFVQFDNAESATMAIAKCEHNIDGKTVKAKAADIQTKFEVPATVSPCNILNKSNEHCLMEIFGYLSVSDLCSVGNVCKHFQTIAKKVFSVKAPVVKTICIQNWSLFRLFGPEIKTVDIDFGFNGDRILDLLTTFCSEPTCALNKIIIRNWNIKGECMEHWKAIFSRIQILHIAFTPTNGTVAYKKILNNNCNKLIDLQLNYINFSDISKIIFPQLESLNLRRILGLNNFLMNRFLKSHPQLKKLMIHTWSGKLTPEAFRNIGVNILEFHLLGNIKISTTDVYSMLDHIKKLKNLKSLGLNCSSLSADRVLGILIEYKLPIEELHLTNLQIDLCFVKAIKSLEHLKKIHFSEGDWNDKNLFVEIVKAHPQLQSIRLNSFGNITVDLIIELVKFAPCLEYMKTDGKDFDIINSDGFTSIVESVKNRPTKKKLKIELCCHGLDHNVPDQMKLENREWLEIQIEGNTFDDTDSDEYYWSDDTYFDSDYPEYDDYDNDDIYNRWPIF